MGHGGSKVGDGEKWRLYLCYSRDYDQYDMNNCQI